MSQQVKKYRLIKLYPGSPILNIEVTRDFNGNYNNFGNNNVVAQLARSIPKYIVENHPEYWEEVIEKDYEILSYYGGKPGHSVYKLTDCKKGFTPYHKHLDVIYAKFTLEYMKNNKHWFIHSVKRLSDGVVFTIGDKVTYSNNPKFDFTIEEITFDHSYGLILKNNNTAWTRLNDKVKHKKQPIFTSTDGFEMFYGDKYYVAQTVNGNLKGSLIEFKVNGHILHNPEYYDKFPDIKRFAKEENCRQYIVDNMKKPLFTTEDGVDIMVKENGEFSYWSLQLDNWRISNASYDTTSAENIKPTPADKLLKYCNELRFSTKAKAEEYILYNKPCLSLNDVATVYVTANQRINIGTPQNAQVRRIKQLAKSKL